MTNISRETCHKTILSLCACVLVVCGTSGLACPSIEDISTEHIATQQGDCDNSIVISQNTVLGVLKSRQYIVEIEGAERGVAYTVKDLAGAILAEAISADEVVVLFPQLHHLVKGVADEASIFGGEQGIDKGGILD